MGWLDVGTFWHVVQNLGMWLPYCVFLPAWLRRNSGLRWSESYWFKYQLFLAVWVFYCTYFHTEYFFEVLGLRYRFPEVGLYFDAALVGPDEATAAASFEKVPIGMYWNAIAFFVVYHTAAVVCMRRVRAFTLGFAPLARRLAWAAIVGAVTIAWYGTWKIAAIIAAATLINLLCAAAVGVMVPLALKRMKIDPALSAGVILTTFTDCIGFATLLGLGALFLT